MSESPGISKADLAYANFNYFCEYAFNEKYPNTWFHRKWCEAIQNRSVTRAINLSPRNSGKTTIWAKKAPLWLLGRNPNLKILMVSRTLGRASTNMRFIKGNIEGNPRIREIFPDLKPSQPWSDDEIVVENSRLDSEASVLARGLEGSITGFRADVLIVDDLIDKTNVMTETQRSKVHEFWDEQVVPTLNPEARVFLVGTRYHSKDFYSRMLEEEEYKDNVFKITAFETDEEGREVKGPDGKPVSYWPDRWSTDRLLALKREISYNQGSIAWESQFMNNPTGFEGRLFKTDWLNFYSMEDIEARLGRLDYVMAVDPNITVTPRSDNTAIITAAVDKGTNEVYILDIVAQQLEFVDQLKILNEYSRRTQLRVGKTLIPGEQYIRVIGVEAVAYQKALQQSGYLMGLPVVEVQHTKTDKLTRILRLSPHFENGRIKFPDPETLRVDWWDGFLDEYITYPRGRRDDRLDCLEVLLEVAGVTEIGSSIAFGPGSEMFIRDLMNYSTGRTGLDSSSGKTALKQQSHLRSKT